MVSRLLSLGLREYAEILSKIAYHRHARIDKACGRSSPTDSVGKNLNNIFVVEGVAVLVTGLEVEDLAETALEVYVDNDSIVLKKYQPACIFCGSAEGVAQYQGRNICGACREAIAALK